MDQDRRGGKKIHDGIKESNAPLPVIIAEKREGEKDTDDNEENGGGRG